MNQKLKDWLQEHQLIEVKDYLLAFLKQPLQSIKSIPEWPWPTLLLFAASLAALSSTLNGMISRKLLWVFMGLVTAPIAFVAGIAIVSGFFYYTFYFFFNRELPFKKIYSLLVIASVPNMATYVLEPIAAPFALLGLAATSMLLIVGFVENFELPRKPVTRLIALLFVFYTVIWVFQIIDFTQKQQKFSAPATQESLDILEKELKGI